jgi:hypothetical protein
MKQANDEIGGAKLPVVLSALEKNDLRRTIYDRIVIAVITFGVTFAISAIVAWRDCLRLK